MMLEVGHEFERNGVQFCVVDILNHKGKSYCLLSVERPKEKIDFDFYRYSIESNGDVNLDLIKDNQLISKLFELIEKGNRYE